jgi:NAD(P)H-nitrite reductase large subunit
MKEKKFRIIPNLTLPSVTPHELEALLAATNRFNIQQLRFTANNQIAVSGVEDSDLPGLIRHLERFMTEMGSGDLTVISCQGCSNCTCNTGTALSLEHRLRNLTVEEPLPAKVKVAVAGCPRCCTMPFVRDIGLIPVNGSWKLIFGGNGGAKPRIGDIIAEKLQEDEVLKVIHTCLHIYCTHARKKQRTSRFIETFGIEQFKEKVFSH